MGYALTVDTGSGTHITLVYFTKCSFRDGDAIKQIARAWCASQGLATCPLRVGTMWGPNSILVEGDAAELKRQLMDHFQGLGYELDLGRQGTQAHINVRGNPATPLLACLDLVAGWR
eukprot:gnl/Hemi2/11142_TR3844_c0_g1_i1.p1 gnl/Hemi2/11142_TR3844_c0_g1~~gnl/Hemi2/11142_TR3844_c0_g1_i1.p1  ORF type:complete len:117 (+),score=35.74 gnl/Hemi2/11142_TR3844_c0_g1_i1:126-476(+)